MAFAFVGALEELYAVMNIYRAIYVTGGEPDAAAAVLRDFDFPAVGVDGMGAMREHVAGVRYRLFVMRPETFADLAGTLISAAESDDLVELARCLTLVYVDASAADAVQQPWCDLAKRVEHVTYLVSAAASE